MERGKGATREREVNRGMRRRGRKKGKNGRGQIS